MLLYIPFIETLLLYIVNCNKTGVTFIFWCWKGVKKNNRIVCFVLPELCII